MLRGLFDRSVAESGIATGLSAGLTLKTIARHRGIIITTARAHLTGDSPLLCHLREAVGGIQGFLQPFLQ